jgi:chemotaxis protein MotB
MARRKRVEVQINHDRWLVSYADFITLLFAFFVVMYSVSSINEDKYRVLSDSMVAAFQNPDPVVEMVGESEIVVASPLPADLIRTVPTEIIVEEAEEVTSGLPEEAPKEKLERDFSQDLLDSAEIEVNKIAENVESRLEESIDEGIISIKRNKFWLEVEIKSNLLFPSGGSRLIPESIPLLVELSDSFVDLPNRIHIEGFTDNEPINTPEFPSNWELSGARAAAVVRLFERNGVAPSRLAAIGYGEYHPVAENLNEEGRAKNRRVVLIVMASLEEHKNERIYEFELFKGLSAGE